MSPAGLKVRFRGVVYETIGDMPILNNPCDNALFHPDSYGFGMYRPFWVFDSKDLAYMEVLNNG